VICIFGTNITAKKHWPVLMILMFGLSTSLIGCSSSPIAKTNSLTSNTAPATTTPTPPTDSTTPPLDSTTTPTNTTSQNVSQSGKTTTPTKVVGKAGAISKIEYDKLQYGLTYEKVKVILGDTGDVVTESGTKGNKGYTVTYHLKTSANGEVFLAFKDNKLVNKMEVNLQ